MKTASLHPGRTDPVTAILILSIIMMALIAGRDVIAWLLMKLYEIFIRQNPLK